MARLISNELKISGQAIFEPATQTIEIATIHTEDSGRDELNQMILTIIDHNQQSVKMEWHGLSFEEGSQLLKLVRPGVFNFTYRDPVENKIVTRKFYAGNRNATIYNKKLNLYEVISFDVIDMRDITDPDREDDLGNGGE